MVFVSTDDLNTSLLPSGFVQEELEDQADLCASGFLPKIMCTNSPDNQTRRLTVQLRTETKLRSYTSVRAFIVTLMLVFYLCFCPLYTNSVKLRQVFFFLQNGLMQHKFFKSNTWQMSSVEYFSNS